jgi:hypothetical protein
LRVKRLSSAAATLTDDEHEVDCVANVEFIEWVNGEGFEFTRENVCGADGAFSGTVFVLRVAEVVEDAVEAEDVAAFGDLRRGWRRFEADWTGNGFWSWEDDFFNGWPSDWEVWITEGTLVVVTWEDAEAESGLNEGIFGEIAAALGCARVVAVVVVMTVLLVVCGTIHGELEEVGEICTFPLPVFLAA